MPSFSFSSSIRVASQEHVLRLNITHNLVHGSPSDHVRSVKGRFPKEVDILWLSDVAISLSGSLDAYKVPAYDIARSGLAHHLHTRLRMNADRLGLNNVSRPFVDDVDGLSKLMLTPSRPLPHPSRPHATLVSLHLAYIWKSISRRGDIDSSDQLVEEADPFSATLFLPTTVLLERVTEQFLIHHFVGRYPLIFGPWCKRLDLEMQYFSSIGHSIVEIMTRSDNRRFLSKCKRLLKIARNQHDFVLQTSAAALFSLTDDDTIDKPEEENDDRPVTSVLTDEQILCESLEQLFRVGVSQRRFKPAATPQLVSLSHDDDNLLQSLPDEKTDEDRFWAELPDITPPSCADLCQTEDMFAKEEWFEDVMWRLSSSADAMLVPSETMVWETQSDESLIDASISSASITTSSPQAFPFTHYHHHYVDACELDPAGGGSCDASQSADLEEAGRRAQIDHLTHSPLSAPHDPCYSDDQVTQGLASFERLDGWSSDEEDSEWILDVDQTSDVDDDLDWL